MDDQRAALRAEWIIGEGAVYELRVFYDPFLRRDVKWSTWRPDPAEVVRLYIDKYRPYRPLQQRARDGTFGRLERDRRRAQG